MELNGVHQLMHDVKRLNKEGGLSTVGMHKLLKTLDLLDRYLTAYENLTEIEWHTVCANPDGFPNNSEVTERVWKRIKSAAGINATDAEMEVAAKDEIDQIYKQGFYKNNK